MTYLPLGVTGAQHQEKTPGNTVTHTQQFHRRGKEVGVFTLHPCESLADGGSWGMLIPGHFRPAWLWQRPTQLCRKLPGSTTWMLDVGSQLGTLGEGLRDNTLAA